MVSELSGNSGAALARNELSALSDRELGKDHRPIVGVR